MRLRRPINSDKSPRHIRMLNKRLMNAFPQRKEVRIKGTHDNACVFGTAAVQADEISTVQRQQDALLGR